MPKVEAHRANCARWDLCGESSVPGIDFACESARHQFRGVHMATALHGLHSSQKHLKATSVYLELKRIHRVVEWQVWGDEAG